MERLRLPEVWLLLVAVAVLGAAGCGSSSDGETAAAAKPVRTTLVPGSPTEPDVPLPKGDPPKDLVIEDLKEGEGIVARKGNVLVTELVAKFVTGERLESSWDQGSQPFVFELGAEEANPGWEKGVPGMRVGGRRLLIVPPDEGSRFGPVGDGKPKDTLVYVVDLIAISPPELRERDEPKLAPPKGAPPENLEVRSLIEGTGPQVRGGDLLTVEYVGIRYDGEPFTNSWKREKEFRFKLGAGSLKVNPGWEKGLQGMRVGERRELVIPPKLQYQGGALPESKPSDTLVYVIDLVGITEPD